jgi:hypothetical protein
MKPQLGLFAVGALLILGWLSVGAVASVAAHGGGDLYLANEPVGDCLVSVWAAPSQPQANTPLHITVGVAAASDGAPILDAQVAVAVAAEDGAVVQTAVPATTANSINKLFYEADLNAFPADNYEIQTTVTCLGATDTITFLLTVQPADYTRQIIMGITVGILLLGLFLWRTWRKKHPVMVAQRPLPHPKQRPHSPK